MKRLKTRSFNYLFQRLDSSRRAEIFVDVNGEQKKSMQRLWQKQVLLGKHSTGEANSKSSYQHINKPKRQWRFTFKDPKAIPEGKEKHHFYLYQH